MIGFTLKRWELTSHTHNDDKWHWHHQSKLWKVNEKLIGLMLYEMVDMIWAWSRKCPQHLCWVMCDLDYVQDCVITRRPPSTYWYSGSIHFILRCVSISRTGYVYWASLWKIRQKVIKVAISRAKDEQRQLMRKVIDEKGDWLERKVMVTDSWKDIAK